MVRLGLSIPLGGLVEPWIRNLVSFYPYTLILENKLYPEGRMDMQRISTPLFVGSIPTRGAKEKTI